MPVKVSRPLKVMLIDDNIIDLKINSKIITITGLFDEIIMCQSAEEAIAYFQDHAAQPDQLPNLILLDIQMPEMDGFEFLEQYKGFPEILKGKTSIAMLSSTLDFGDIRRAEANSYVIQLLKKPLMTANVQAIFEKSFKVVE
ncbi:response regulator [Pedobacter sp. AW31-3R]|uniref:response regulator n=1 Tax=Pedobacter sp. AW31-3R TaxID=3445781 RepID=UPI003F9EDC4B